MGERWRRKSISIKEPNENNINMIVYCCCVLISGFRMGESGQSMSEWGSEGERERKDKKSQKTMEHRVVRLSKLMMAGWRNKNNRHIFLNVAMWHSSNFHIFFFIHIFFSQLFTFCVCVCARCGLFYSSHHEHNILGVLLILVIWFRF